MKSAILICVLDESKAHFSIQLRFYKHLPRTFANYTVQSEKIKASGTGAKAAWILLYVFAARDGIKGKRRNENTGVEKERETEKITPIFHNIT